MSKNKGVHATGPAHLAVDHDLDQCCAGRRCADCCLALQDPSGLGTLGSRVGAQHLVLPRFWLAFAGVGSNVHHGCQPVDRHDHCHPRPRRGRIPALSCQAHACLVGLVAHIAQCGRCLDIHVRRPLAQHTGYPVAGHFGAPIADSGLGAWPGRQSTVRSIGDDDWVDLVVGRDAISRCAHGLAGRLGRPLQGAPQRPVHNLFCDSGGTAAEHRGLRAHANGACDCPAT